MVHLEKSTKNSELEADIYVIQECEPLDKIKGELKKLISNGIWEKGANKKGVTTKPAYIVEFYIWQLVNSGRINEDVVI